jgi:hypothetical protein
MAEAEKPIPAATGVSIILAAIASLLWLFAIAVLSDLGRSDAAGNALGQAYAAILIILLFVLLAILAIVAAVKGTSPKWAVVAATILIPASGIATMIALDLLARPYEAPFRWPLVVPALIPPLIIAFCLWALLPSLRGRRFAHATPTVVWSAVALLCLAVWPLTQIRAGVVAQFEQGREKYARDFAAMRPDAPLWEWTPFLDTPGETRSGDARDRIKVLPNRQSEAGVMLERGDFPLRYLASFDLTPDAALCEKARGLLRRQAEQRMPKSANRPYREVARAVDDAINAMYWLVGYGCSCDAETLAWETVAKSYTGAGYDLTILANLRDPKALGRILREDPARASMLNEQSHLRAWLKFADDRALRDQMLAGARKLDHRTADAVVMLRETSDISTPWLVMRYLPVLDFETTPEFCSAALGQIRTEIAKVYRPTPDSPRPYSELLERLGYGGVQLPALQWLASHGCDADATLTETQALITTYQNSPQRAAMLASLERLHKK